jgi:hypothetical protein
MNRRDVTALANRLMAQHLTGANDSRHQPIFGWTFGINSNKARLGVCRYDVKRIEVSIYHLANPDASITDTILHEIAHVLTPGEHHNWRWQQVARTIGANGQRCGVEPLAVKPNYIGTCAKCAKEIPRFRLKRTMMADTVHHTPCGPEGKISWRRVR